MNERKTEVRVEITTQYYNANGELIEAIESKAKLSKADAGRTIAVDEDSLIFKHNPNESTKGQIDYNGTTNSTGDDVNINTTVELDIKGQVQDATRGELIDAIAASAKLTKADAGRMANETSEEWLNLEVSKAVADNGLAVVTKRYKRMINADA